MQRGELTIIKDVVDLRSSVRNYFTRQQLTNVTSQRNATIVMPYYDSFGQGMHVRLILAAPGTNLVPKIFHIFSGFS